MCDILSIHHFFYYYLDQRKYIFIKFSTTILQVSECVKKA